MVDLALPRGAVAGQQLPILPLSAAKLSYGTSSGTWVGPIDLTIDQAGVTVVLGPNGAGKSVLLRLLHGLLEPTTGHVTWNGRPMDREIRLRQAMVFQSPVVLRRSVAANLRYALRIRGYRGAALHERLDAWLSHADLVPQARRPATVLSGGEKQRLAIARALCGGPDVLFLDEPAANLDGASVIAIEKLLQTARDNGTKLVLVTHDLHQARRMADEVVFMVAGQVRERAPASRFFDQPHNPQAQAFIDGRIVL